AHKEGRTAPEFTTLNDFFQKEIGRRIEITGSPDAISIEKREDKNLSDHRITFNVRQKSAVPMGEQHGAIQVRFPVAFVLDKTINYCPYDDWSIIPERAFSYRYETRTIPLLLETAEESVGMQILQDKDRLTARVKFEPISLIDAGASWFEVEGRKHWFEVQGDDCIANAPVREGTVHFKVAAAHKLARPADLQESGNPGDNIFFREGDYIVKMSPPVIAGFSYDRQANALLATVTDEGTLAGNLD
ncbi:MAG: hypothetical protein GY697_10880, partial [Desulfobacterales bacterium]|nr:hypothetical protein [Desulfobacterales bacterium]